MQLPDRGRKLFNNLTKYKADFLLRNVAPRQGTETFFYQAYNSQLFHVKLRNVAPRQGTETPKGNLFLKLFKGQLRNVAPRQGTETSRRIYGDTHGIIIEKCSSPIGDGNCLSGDTIDTERPELRNVAPRQGTETFLYNYDIFIDIIEKCSSPIGDGNDNVYSDNSSFYY